MWRAQASKRLARAAAASLCRVRKYHLAAAHGAAGAAERTAYGQALAEETSFRWHLWAQQQHRVASAASPAAAGRVSFSSRGTATAASGAGGCGCGRGAASQAGAKGLQTVAAAESQKIKISVNGREIETEEGKTILQACRDHNIYIPAICFHPSLKPAGTCRLCLVDAGGWRLEPACVKQVTDGMTVFTKNDEITDTVKGNLALMRMKHPNVCSTCSACNNCEFQDLLMRYKVDDLELLHKKPRVNPSVEAQGIAHAHDTSSPSLQFDFDKCILCLRCVRACSELQGMNVLGAMARGESETVAPLFALPLSETACLSCGACVAVCPVAAITEKSAVDDVRELLEQSLIDHPPESRARMDELIPLDKDDRRVLWGPLPSAAHSATSATRAGGQQQKHFHSSAMSGVARTPWQQQQRRSSHSHSDVAPYPIVEPTGKPPVVVVQTAPAVRVTISEAFGMAPGAISTGQLVSALRQLGFNYIFDVNFSADLTIMEEATELLGRLKSGGPFPMFTSCCPGWINMVEKTYPDLIPNLSSCKSPQQMLGAVVKTYFAAAINRHPSEVKVVSVMPCVAKKDEASREEHINPRTGLPDIDHVLTTRELAKLIETARPRIHFASLKEEQYDNPLGESSGAALLFGVTGGVMEAALRTAVAVTAPPGSPVLPRLNFTEVRGLQGVREATVDVNGLELKVAIANGGANLRKLVDAIRAGDAPEYHFIEMMACRGGCIGGAGNPKDAIDDHLLQRRAAAVYQGDEAASLRESHNNKDINQLYSKFLGEPNSHLAHELLHTHYAPREVMGTGIYFPDHYGMAPSSQ